DHRRGSPPAAGLLRGQGRHAAEPRLRAVAAAGARAGISPGACCSTNRRPALATQLPGHAVALDQRRYALPESLLNHRLPGHQAEADTIVEQGITAAGQLHAAPVDPADSLALDRRAVLHTRLRRDIARRRGQL